MAVPGPGMVAALGWLPLWQVLVAVAAAASLLALRRVAGPGGGWAVLVRRRLILGVPWGTLLTMLVVLAVYLFLQGGLGHWHAPVVVSFRAWSYFYPLGVLAAGLSHAGPGHLTGNLLGALVFGSLAEFAWGHFPTERGAASFGGLRTNPYVRMLAVPVVAVLAAVFTGLFGLGPVIGFSGVVFAMAGFSLVRLPVATVVALAVADVLDVVYRALLAPVITASGGPSFSTPWWAGIAIQGHALGLFLGIVAAVLVVHRRGDRPPAGRVWLAALAFAVAQGLWAVYAYQGGQYVLYRAGGVALAFLLATLVTAGVAASGRTLIARIDLSRREAAVGLLGCFLLALALVGVPYNLVTPAPADPPADAVEVRDYTVFYAEDVPNQLVAGFEVDVPGFETSNVTASGVIVTSQRRAIWWEQVSTARLAFTGQQRVRVGGVGWRGSVVANRSGWSTAGGPVAYRVTLHRPGEPPRVAFRSEPATADPTIAGRNVTVAPAGDGDGFVVRVDRANRTLGQAPLPSGNSSVRVAGLVLERDGRSLYAVRNDTRVRVAVRERYQ